MTSYTTLEELNQKYNPDHDIGPDAPVSYQLHVVIDALQSEITAIAGLKERIDALENPEINPFLLSEAEIERSLKIKRGR